MFHVMLAAAALNVCETAGVHNRFGMRLHNFSEVQHDLWTFVDMLSFFCCVKEPRVEILEKEGSPKPAPYFKHHVSGKQRSTQTSWPTCSWRWCVLPGFFNTIFLLLLSYFPRMGHLQVNTKLSTRNGRTVRFSSWVDDTGIFTILTRSIDRRKADTCNC